MQMQDHELGRLKGWNANLSFVDCAAPLSPNVSVTPVYAGTVVHLNQQMQFELGAKGTDMPVFLYQASTDFDVSNYGGADWIPIAPTGTMAGLVATGGYELSTTEFDQSAGVQFYPGDILHAPTESQITGTDKRMAGKIFKTATWNGGTAALTRNNNICGTVSRPSGFNYNRKKTMYFWPCYLPGDPAEA